MLPPVPLCTLLFHLLLHELNAGSSLGQDRRTAPRWADGAAAQPHAMAAVRVWRRRPSGSAGWEAGRGGVRFDWSTKQRAVGKKRMNLMLRWAKN
ncbi:hypothetical protein GQ55_3G068200 [Panicum hallii var. hallii]|uniref:Secreted protein n=1 Tax=Panicum hallii var. hallii TaxID=1504633 RepID=A0A2T7E6I0_9POAL|nr:hypothetical protein GQ55_3G068200 [Panicum hallii var. hallii]